MAERFTFSVNCDYATLKPALRRYVFRILFLENTWTSYLVIFGIVTLVGLIVFARRFDFLSGLFGGLCLTAWVLALVVYFEYLRAIAARFARLRKPIVDFSLEDDLIAFASDGMSGRMPWGRIRAIWKDESVWLLKTDGNQLITLPLAGAPAEALKFLESKVQPRRL